MVGETDNEAVGSKEVGEIDGDTVGSAAVGETDGEADADKSALFEDFGGFRGVLGHPKKGLRKQ